MRPLFSSPAQPPSPQQPFPTATALAARRHPHAAVPAATAAPRSNHSLLQPPPPQRPPYLSQRRVADEPWRRMFAARTARHRPHAALRRAVTRTLPSPQHPPRRPMKLASIPHAAAALRHRPARIAPYAFSFRRMHAISPLPGNVCPKCMLFEIGMARSSPYASISRCNRVVLDTWRKDLAGKVPFSRRETRNHAWHEDAARAFGLQSGQKK